MHLEIVSHCWRYSKLLTYQLSSLVLFPPEQVAVTMTVFCASPADDPDTWNTLRFFDTVPKPPTVSFRWWPLDPSRLFRRAIGRNIIATQTNADWIWYADCDMAFGSQAIDLLNQELTDRVIDLAYPRQIQIHRDHALGDAAIARVTAPGLYAVSPDEFIPHRYHRAIGGVQICRTRAIRELGYCRSKKWQTPVKRWNFRDDVAFRRTLKTAGHPVMSLPVYRIRHSRNGRQDLAVML